MLFWFDRDLRLDDNPALAHAAARAGELLCVYCHDAGFAEADAFGTPRLGRHRAAFIEASLRDLDASLAARGQSLRIVHGDPVAEIGRLIGDRAIDAVVRSRSFGWYENQHWRLLRARHPRIDFVEIDGATLFDEAQIDAIGELPETFSRFRRRAERLDIAVPIVPPELPQSVSGDDSGAAPGWFPGTLETRFEGGESAARAHCEAYFASAAPGRYKQTRNALAGWSNSSKFSPWLAAGCVSPRQLLACIREYEAEHGANDSTYWLFFELLWREYFHWYARTHGARLFRFAGIGERAPATAFDRDSFAAWCAGETGYPLVDACLHELNATGYLSNRGRQIAASALVNELGQDWRAGAGYFERQLIDYDVASNWGNWQYIAGVGADPRGGRHFNLDKQAREYDPEGEYVERWAAADSAGATVAGAAASIG